MSAGLRSFDTRLPAETWSDIQRGTMRTRYRDRRCLKSPFDLVLYLQLIQRLRPATLIEIGVNDGGSALWFADTMRAHGLPPNVIGIDRVLPEGIAEPGVALLVGDAHQLGQVLSDERLGSLPRPWLVVEDSSHHFETSLAVMQFFDPWLHTGDYLVIEDGIVEFMPEPHYRQYACGPSRAIAAFLESRAGQYEVDTELCDYFGRNTTYNPNGWLRRR
jgi:cephalosporin hydroxylase